MVAEDEDMCNFTAIATLDAQEAPIKTSGTWPTTNKMANSTVSTTPTPTGSGFPTCVPSICSPAL